MATLSSKSNQELSQLLDEYGIKHGPVVGSTRSLYEKKLRDAMAKERKAKPSYYREEEEVTYINHRRPFGHGSYRDRSEYRDLDTTDDDSASSEDPIRSPPTLAQKGLGTHC
ncbi:hypothetical protein P4O66_022696, partial [Electrophorus voltai]